MAAVCRVAQTTGSRSMKSSKQLTGALASAPLKRHVPVIMPKGMIGMTSKSPSISTLDSSCERRSGFNGGKTTLNHKTSLGKKDAPEDAKASCSEVSSETTATEFVDAFPLEASDDMSSQSFDADETKRIVDVAEPSFMVAGLQFKDLDVVDSNVQAMSWFSVDDLELDYFLQSNADKNPVKTGSKSSSAADLNLGHNNGQSDEIEEAVCRVKSMNAPAEDKKFEEGSQLNVEESSLKTPDVTQISNLKDICYDSYARLASSKTSEGTMDANGQLESKHFNAVSKLIGDVACGICVNEGLWAIGHALASLFVILTLWSFVGHLIEDELSMLRPLT